MRDQAFGIAEQRLIRLRLTRLNRAQARRSDFGDDCRDHQRPEACAKSIFINANSKHRRTFAGAAAGSFVSYQPHR